MFYNFQFVLLYIIIPNFSPTQSNSWIERTFYLYVLIHLLRMVHTRWQSKTKAANLPCLYSGDPEFYCRLEKHVCRLVPSRRISGWCLKLGHDKTYTTCL